MYKYLWILVLSLSCQSSCGYPLLDLYVESEEGYTYVYPSTGGDTFSYSSIGDTFSYPSEGGKFSNPSGGDTFAFPSRADTFAKCPTDYQHGYYLDIVCKILSKAYGPQDLTLMKDGNIVDGVNETADGIMKQISGEFAGTYTCVLQTSIPATNGATLNLQVNVQLTIIEISTTSASMCTTSLGESVVIGELVDIYCFSGGVCWKCQESIIVTRNQQTYACDLYDQLHTLEVDIVSDIEISISPQNFSSTEDLKFTCSSVPHRLIYWDIYGTKGSLLNYNFAELFLTVDTNITISRSIDSSILTISDPDGGNGIHTVVCYTYDTVRKISKASYYVDSPVVTTPSGRSSDFQHSSPQSSLASSASPSSSSVDVIPPSADNQTFIIQGGAAVATIVIIVALTALSSSLGICVVLLKRSAKRSETTQKSEDFETPRLYYNPAYRTAQQTSSTNDVPNDGHEYTYINKA